MSRLIRSKTDSLEDDFGWNPTHRRRLQETQRIPKLKKLNVANTSIGFDVIDELAESKEGLEIIEFEN